MTEPAPVENPARPSLAGLCLLSWILLSASTCQAMEWRPDSAFGAEIEYTDNLYMVADNPTADTFFNGNANFRLTGESYVRRIRLDAGAQIQRLQRTRDANNEFYTAGLAYRENFDQARFDLQTQYNEGSTRTTDLETIGPSPNFIFGKRRAFMIQPRLEVSTNENNRLALAAGYDDIRYDLPNLTDYTNSHVRFDWFHSLNETLELDTQLVAQRYESKDNLVNNDYGSVLEIVDVDASERWHYQFGGGLGYLVRKSAENYRTFLGRFSATRTGDRSRFNIRAESSLQPTAAARLSRLSRFSLGYHLEFDEYRTLDTEIRVSRSNIIDVTPAYDNDVLGFNIGYRAYLSQRLNWSVRYAYTNNRTSRDTRDRISNSLFLSMTLAFNEQ